MRGKTQKMMRQEINRIYRDVLQSPNNQKELRKADDNISWIDFRQESIKTLEKLRPLLSALEESTFTKKQIKYLDRELKDKLETQDYINSTTCETCRRLIYTIDRSDNKRFIMVAVSKDGWESLNQCPDCGRYFTADQRAYRHISKEEAEKQYPESFS